MDKKGLHIIIVGCGKVGRSLTAQLRKEGHDITLIDRDESKLSEMENTYDIMSVNGNGASYSVQQDAGVNNADLLIAVTGSDELNLLCCTVAKRAANCAAIARVRDPDYSVDAEYLREKLGLALIVNPELETAREISYTLTLPIALDVNPFAGGLAELVRVKIEEGNPLIGKKLLDFGKRIAGAVLICAVEREGAVYIPSGSFELKKGDIVSFVTERKIAQRVFQAVGIKTGQVKSAMIIGGGMGGYYLARRLIARGVEVKIIEKKRSRCEELAEVLHDAIIINGDALSTDLLREEGIEYVESVISLTGIDEQNIFLSLYARMQNPTAKTLTRISRMQFREVLPSLELGSVIDPKTVTTEEIVAYVRAKNNSRGENIVTLYHLYDERVEAVEFRVGAGSPVAGIPLMNLQMKDNLLIACINRNGHVIIPTGMDQILAGDTVMVVTTHLGMKELSEISA
ncbi:MAG: Trk system potassium transporter TrkA [Lachnospiraceae bacterium]|nr:Trk system potassium transporter TrkA [Lachnospiraceae bacterium]